MSNTDGLSDRMGQVQAQAKRQFVRMACAVVLNLWTASGFVWRQDPWGWVGAGAFMVLTMLLGFAAQRSWEHWREIGCVAGMIKGR